MGKEATKKRRNLELEYINITQGCIIWKDKLQNTSVLNIRKMAKFAQFLIFTTSFLNLHEIQPKI